MFKHQVREPGQALAYLIDCTLATVCDLAMRKTRGANEFKRQKSIAQTAIHWAVDFGVDLNGTRAGEIVAAGQTVDEWAARFDVKEAA